MGNLITETPISEMNATIELLDRLGVDRDGLKRFRKASSYEQMTIAEMIQNGMDRKEMSVKPSDLLTSRGVTTVTLTESYDPKTYYQNSSGFYVFSNFLSQVVAQAKPSEAGKAYKVESFKLTRDDATDAEIELALPDNHLFDETTLCAVIAGLIDRQPNGKSGTLLNNGYASPFYLLSCVVHVSWSADDRAWVVRAWGRGGYGWLAGLRRVFSPCN